MLDASRPFMDSVAVTLPYLKARSVGGGLMVLGHLVFAAHFIALALGIRAAARPAGAAAPMVRQEGGGMNSEIRLLSGAMVMLAATSALVVLPHLRCTTRRRCPASSPMAGAVSAGAPFTSPTAACTATRSSRAHRNFAPDFARMGARHGRGRLRLRPAAAAGHHAHRARSDEHRRAPAERAVAPRPPVPAARLRAGQHHAQLPFLFEAKAQADKGDVVVNLPALGGAGRPVVVARPEAVDLVATCSRSTAATRCFAAPATTP